MYHIKWRSLRLTFALVLFLSFTAILLWWWWSNRPDIILANARREAELVLATPKPRERDRHARQCGLLCNKLLSAEGRIGTTAALFTIGITPLYREATNVAIPNAQQVEQLLTSDLILVSRLMFHTRRFGPSDQLLDLILSREDEDRVTALRLASMVRFELGRDEDVLKHCDELISLVPDDANAYRVKALVHKNHGKWEHFVDAAERSFQLSGRSDHSLQLELIDGYIRLGRTKDARREFELVQSQRPDLIAEALILNAQLLVQEGRPNEAYLIAAQHLKEAPNDIDGLMLMSKIDIAEGRFAEAIVALKNVLNLSPSEELAHYQLGQAYARMGDSKQAEESLQRHRKILDTKVQLNSLEQLAAREPRNIMVRKELARLYLELGMNDLAEFWVRAVQAAEGH